jgi:hypothetical protein
MMGNYLDVWGLLVHLKSKLSGHCEKFAANLGLNCSQRKGGRVLVVDINPREQ